MHVFLSKKQQLSFMILECKTYRKLRHFQGPKQNPVMCCFGFFPGNCFLLPNLFTGCCSEIMDGLGNTFRSLVFVGFIFRLVNFFFLVFGYKDLKQGVDPNDIEQKLMQRYLAIALLGYL